MRQLPQLFCLLLLASLAGCATSPPWQQVTPDSPLPKILAFDKDKTFIDAQGKRFFPWGFNYTEAAGVGLIDDNLYSDESWRIIDQDFAEMKSYGANIVRVHLQYHRFMIDPGTPDYRAFAALERLLDIAERHRLYLMITGLGAYRKADSPPWYDELSTGERWETQALFWQTLAAHVGHSNAVFAYDLMNEPVVSVCPEGHDACEWLVGNNFAGFHFVQNVSIDPGRTYAGTLTEWKNTLNEAIRREDDVTMTTVGHLSLADLNAFEDNLDFLSFHIYPREGEIGSAVWTINWNVTERPLVISEFFNLYCSIDDLEHFVKKIEGKYQGLIGHYDGRTLEDLGRPTELPDMLRLEFLQFFIQHSNQGRATGAPPTF
jgi:hypothetical protein